MTAEPTNTKKYIYNGYITTDEYGFLCFSKNSNPRDYEHGSSLAATIQDDIKDNPLVSVRYFICDKKTNLEEAEKLLIYKMFGGKLNVEYELDAYSEYTIEEWNQDLTVGGHDLIQELNFYNEKYAILVIEIQQPASQEGASQEATTENKKDTK